MIVLLYIAAMVAANLLVWRIGPWASPFIAFALIGLDLTLRDVLHERLSRWQMLGMILAGGIATWLLNPAVAQIALASAVAFACAALVDWAVYGALRGRSWTVRANGSNVAGAAVDSVVFPTLAFGALMPEIIALQFAAKVAGGAVWAMVLRRA